MAVAELSPDCLFCRIAAGATPVERLYEDEQILAFPDINPQAPKHILLIPKQHLASVAHALEEHAAMLGALLGAAPLVAKAQGLSQGFRLVVNTGQDGGQTVDHLHLHLLGGRTMHWPPG